MVKPQHLNCLARLVERHPELTVVIDHGAKPDTVSWGPAGAASSAWADSLRSLAQSQRIYGKLSGLVTGAAPDWQPSDLRPYVDVLLEAFAPDRLIWGSDWPVVNLAGGYAAWWQASKLLLAGLSKAELVQVLGGNAARCYRI